MFARLFAVASLAALAIAGPAPLAARGQCNTGAINCCNNVSQSKNAHYFFGQDVVDVLADVTGNIAWNCSPISLVGVLNPGAQCSSQTVCCSDNKFNGVIQTGCTPINL